VSEAITTPNTSVATELDAILAENSSWYGLGIESRVALQNQRAAGWAQSNNRLFIGQSSDADILTTATTDIATTLKDLSYFRAATIYIATDTEDAPMAWEGQTLAVDPDLQTTIWKFKELAGVTIQDLTATEVTNLQGKNCNVYGFMGGTGITADGIAADGTPLDIVLTVDWMTSRIIEKIQQLLKDTSQRGEKIPYTDAGINTVAEKIKEVISQGQDVGHLNPDPETVTFDIPTRASVPSADVTARRLALSFTVEAAGAIENVTVNGTVLSDL
jgi:hypothetical protein